MPDTNIVDRETRVFSGEYYELLYESEDYTLVDRQPLDDLRHGWLRCRLILKENSTGKFFCFYARYNDDDGWEDTWGEIKLTEVFLKKKMVAFYE